MSVRHPVMLVLNILLYLTFFIRRLNDFYVTHIWHVYHAKKLSLICIGIDRFLTKSMKLETIPEETLYLPVLMICDSVSINASVGLAE